MAARRTTQRTRGFRPQTEWSSLSQAAPVTVAAATSLLLGSFTSTLPVTVRRTFGLLNWRSDQNSGDENPIGAFGMCVVSNEAFAAGAAAIPAPFTDAASDLWFVHQYMMSAFEVVTAVGFEGSSGRQYALNSKAMRKLSDDESVAVVVENGTAAQGALFWFGLRVLSSGSSA